MTARIIPAKQRVADTRGVKALILGPTGVGKTSQLRTLDLQKTLFIDIEAGDLAVQDLRRRHAAPAHLAGMPRPRRRLGWR